MASDSDDTIRAKVLSVLDRKGFYKPKHGNVENLAKMAAVATSDEGRARELTHEMARDDSYPVEYVQIDETVALKIDSQRWTASRIQSLDDDVLEWSQRQRL